MKTISKSLQRDAQKFDAIATVRWLIFINSLRTMRGRTELVARVLMGFWFAALGLGGAVLLGMVAWFIFSRNRTEWLAALLWPVFLLWVFMPLLVATSGETFDSCTLLRYPLNYSSFFCVRVIYGSFEASTFVGIVWLLGIEIGTAIATPRLTVWTALTLGVFGVVNIFVVLAVFAWLERWLARRRTREIMGVVFLLLIVSFQLIGPATRWVRRKHVEFPAVLMQAEALQKFAPPGLAAQAISQAQQRHWWSSVGVTSSLVGYGAFFLLLLHVRLRAQYAGENLGEGIAGDHESRNKAEARLGWRFPCLSSPVAAIMEKEIRCLWRSGPLLFTLIIPVVFLLIFRMSTGSRRTHAFSGGLAFPVGAGYALLLLSNLIYNTFGTDGVGVQFYFLSPVRVRDVLLAKNLVYTCVLLFEISFIWVAICFLFRPPSAAVAAATVTAVVFAAPLDFCAGNLLSLYAPKKYDYAIWGRQRAPNTTVLASFGVQAVIVGLAALTLLAARRVGSLWVATAIFAALATGGVSIYHLILQRVDGIALRRRESLIAELSRAS